MHIHLNSEKTSTQKKFLPILDTQMYEVQSSFYLQVESEVMHDSLIVNSVR